MRFSGVLSDSYFNHISIELTEDVDSIFLSFKTKKNKELQFFLWDTNGNLRFSYIYGRKKKNEFELNDKFKEEYASFKRGIFEKGLWTLGVYLLKSKEHKESQTLPAKYRIIFNTRLENSKRKEEKREAYNVEINERWYKGDTHVHTKLSDGKLNFSKLDNLRKKKDLDFVFVTDHNIFPLGQINQNLFKGMEFTSPKGHFNILGIKNDIKFEHLFGEIGFCDELCRVVIDEAKKEGGFVVLNHPYFREWSWKYDDKELLKQFDFIEVISDPTYVGAKGYNEKAIKKLDELWDLGIKIWGLGGSDFHSSSKDDKKSYKKEGLANPTTWVMSTDNSQKSILEGMKSGKVIVSLQGDLKISFRQNGRDIYPGQNIDMTLIEVEVTYPKAWGDLTVFSKNNSKTEFLLTVKNGRQKFFLEAKLFEKWFRLEFRDNQDNIVIFVNPFVIYDNKE